MSDNLEFTLDKFTFVVPTDRLYTADGLWIMEDGGRLRLGVTDFFQQNSGDVAFAEVAEAGTALAVGARLANIETIKVDVELPAPVSGAVAEVNERLELEAEIINQDPYGDGWLALVEPADWPAEKAGLMSPETYFEHMKAQAIEEAGKQ